MGAFHIPSESNVSSVGYVSTAVFNAREIAESIGRQIEDEWVVSETPLNNPYGDDEDYKVTITVQKV
jgi:hypothetical protein